MDASTARSWPGHDVDATHALIRPYLPANALKELSDYTFLLVELPSKAKTLARTGFGAISASYPRDIASHRYVTSLAALRDITSRGKRMK